MGGGGGGAALLPSSGVPRNHVYGKNNIGMTTKYRYAVVAHSIVNENIIAICCERNKRLFGIVIAPDVAEIDEFIVVANKLVEKIECFFVFRALLRAESRCMLLRLFPCFL